MVFLRRLIYTFISLHCRRLWQNVACRQMKDLPPVSGPRLSFISMLDTSLPQSRPGMNHYTSSSSTLRSFSGQTFVLCSWQKQSNIISDGPHSVVTRNLYSRGGKYVSVCPSGLPGIWVRLNGRFIKSPAVRGWQWGMFGMGTLSAVADGPGFLWADNHRPAVATIGLHRDCCCSSCCLCSGRQGKVY